MKKIVWIWKCSGLQDKILKYWNFCRKTGRSADPTQILLALVFIFFFFWPRMYFFFLLIHKRLFLCFCKLPVEHCTSWCIISTLCRFKNCFRDQCLNTCLQAINALYKAEIVTHVLRVWSLLLLQIKLFFFPFLLLIFFLNIETAGILWP